MKYMSSTFSAFSILAWPLFLFFFLFSLFLFRFFLVSKVSSGSTLPKFQVVPRLPSPQNFSRDRSVKPVFKDEGRETYGSMDGEGLVHVNNDKVIVAVLGAGVASRIELGGCVQEAQHSVEVSLALSGADISPT